MKCRFLIRVIREGKEVCCPMEFKNREEMREARFSMSACMGYELVAVEEVEYMMYDNEQDENNK